MPLEILYGRLFDTMLQGVVYQDAQGKIIAMNPAAQRILGKTPEEFLGQTSVSVEHDTLRENGSPFPGLEHPAMIALRMGREVSDVVMQVYNPREQQYRYISITAVPLTKPGEAAPHEVYTVFDDITEQKAADNQLRKNQEALEKARDDLETRVQERTEELLQTNEQLREEVAERAATEQSLRLEEARLDALLRLSQIGEASVSEIAAFVLEQGITLTSSKIGFVGFLNEDESVYTLHAVSREVVKECNVTGDPLRWHVAGAGLWAEAIRERKTLFINDYDRPHPRKKGLPTGHPPIQRFMVVPVLDGERVVAVAGVGNKESNYDQPDERQMALLLSGMWHKVQQHHAAEALQQAHAELEERVKQRTAELAASNAALRDEIAERRQAEERIEQQNAVLQSLNEILGATLTAATEEDLGQACLDVVERVTSSKFGFVGEIGADGVLYDVAISNPGWEVCEIKDASHHRTSPRDFKIHGIYGRVLLDGKGFFTNNPESHPDRIGVPPGHPPLTSFLGVPLLRDSKIIGMVAVGNRDGGYTQVQLEALEALAQVIVEAFLRKRAEAEAQEGKAILDALMDSVPEGITIAQGPDAKIRMVSRHGQELLGGAHSGLTAEEVADQWKVYETDGVTPLPDADLPLMRAMQNGETVRDAELVQVGASGQRLVLSCNAAPIRDQEGRITGSVVAWRDISDRKRLEEDLHRRQLELQSLFNNSNAGLVLFDAKPPYTVLAHNRYHQELFGEPFRTEGMVGKNVYDYAPEVEAQGVVAVFDQVVRAKEAVNLLGFPYDSNPPDKSWFNWHLSPIIQDGEVVALASMSINVTSQHVAEQALRESEKRYRDLFTSMTEGFAVHEILVDEDGKPYDYRFLALNPAFEKLTGLKVDKLIGKTVLEVLPETEPFWIETYGRVALTGEPAHFEQYASVLDRYYEVFSFQSGVNQFAALFLDITDRKRAEEILEQRVRERTAELAKANVDLHTEIQERLRAEEYARAERKRFHDILEILPSYVVLLTPDYHAPFANRVFRERFGESHGRRCYEHLFGRTEPCEDCETYKVLETNRPHHWQWLGPDGRSYDVFDFPFTDTDGSQLILEMGTDVTERKQAQMALQASEERFRQLAETIHEAFWMLEPDTQRLLYVSPAYDDIWGRSREEVYKRPELFVDTVHPDDRESLLQDFRPGKLDYDREFRILRPDGEVRWVRLRSFPILNDAGEVYRLAGVATDITHQKAAEAAMIQAERTTMAGKMAAALVHEINNPLQSVIGCLGLVEEAIAAGEDPDHYLEVAHEELRRTVGIMSQLRALGRPVEKVRKEPTDLNRVLDDVLTLNRKELVRKKIAVTWKPRVELPLLLLTPDPMRQVFLNLVLNAVDAMPDGGGLRVSIEQSAASPGVTVLIADTGTGIAPDVLPHIFEPFYTTKTSGMGVGLFVCQGIVEQQGGRIEVESQLGAGTTFKVWLPTSD